MTEKTIEQHRQEFEDWFIKTSAFWYDSLEKGVKGYRYESARLSWEAWKSARGIKE